MFNTNNQNAQNKIQFKNQNKSNDKLGTHIEHNELSSISNLTTFT